MTVLDGDVTDSGRMWLKHRIEVESDEVYNLYLAPGNSSHLVYIKSNDEDFFLTFVDLRTLKTVKTFRRESQEKCLSTCAGGWLADIFWIAQAIRTTGEEVCLQLWIFDPEAGTIVNGRRIKLDSTPKETLQILRVDPLGAVFGLDYTDLYQFQFSSAARAVAKEKREPQHNLRPRKVVKYTA